MRFLTPATRLALLAALALVPAPPEAAAQARCSAAGVKSDWRAVALDHPAPEGIAVEWRSHYGRAFDECLNEVTVRLRNSGTERRSVDLGACRIDRKRVAGPLLSAAPGKSAHAMLDLLDVPAVAEVRCAGATAAARPKVRAKAKPAGERKLPAVYLAPVPAGEAARLRELSQKIVVHLLDDAFRHHAAVPLPVATRIQHALARATELREEPGGSLNLQLRNAEYYLHGLYAEVSGDLRHLTSTWFREQYDWIKAVAQKTRFESLLRANPDNPTSPPGGAEWAAAGMRDGERIANEEVANRTEGHGLELRELFR
jgi:hypothetical protein